MLFLMEVRVVVASMLDSDGFSLAGPPKKIFDVPLCQKESIYLPSSASHLSPRYAHALKACISVDEVMGKQRGKR